MLGAAGSIPVILRNSNSTPPPLEDLTQFVGQDRAPEAIQFGVGISRQGFNLLLPGPAGTGKYPSVRSFLSRTRDCLSGRIQKLDTYLGDHTLAHQHPQHAPRVHDALRRALDVLLARVSESCQSELLRPDRCRCGDAWNHLPIGHAG